MHIYHIMGSTKKIGFVNLGINIAKGTTDPRVEFILPK